MCLMRECSDSTGTWVGYTILGYLIRGLHFIWSQNLELSPSRMIVNLYTNNHQEYRSPSSHVNISVRAQDEPRNTSWFLIRAFWWRSHVARRQNCNETRKDNNHYNHDNHGRFQLRNPEMECYINFHISSTANSQQCKPNTSSTNLFHPSIHQNHHNHQNHENHHHPTITPTYHLKHTNSNLPTLPRLRDHNPQDPILQSSLHAIMFDPLRKREAPCE